MMHKLTKRRKQILYTNPLKKIWYTSLRDTQAYLLHQYFIDWTDPTDSTGWTINRPLRQLVWFQLYRSMVEPNLTKLNLIRD